MSNRQTRKNEPCEISLEAGKTYYWCTCGRSATQPFCDGSHQGTDNEPLAFTAEETNTAWLCGCKKTGTPPFCDGTHNEAGSLSTVEETTR